MSPEFRFSIPDESASEFLTDVLPVISKIEGARIVSPQRYESWLNITRDDIKRREVRRAQLDSTLNSLKDQFESHEEREEGVQERINAGYSRLINDVNPEITIEDIRKALGDTYFSRRSQIAIILRYGLADGNSMTFRQIGELFGVQKTRASIIVQGGLRRLKFLVRRNK